MDGNKMYDLNVYLSWLRFGRELLASNRRLLERLAYLIIGALIAPEYRLESRLEHQTVLVPTEHEHAPFQRKQKFY